MKRLELRLRRMEDLTAGGSYILRIQTRPGHEEEDTQRQKDEFYSAFPDVKSVIFIQDLYGGCTYKDSETYERFILRAREGKSLSEFVQKCVSF